MPIHAPAAGVIEELLAEDGSTVQPGKPAFKLRITGDAPAKKKDAAPKQDAPAAPPPPPPPQASAGAIPSSPPPVPRKPSGPISATPTAAVKTPSVGREAGMVVGARTEQRVKMNRMRQRISQRLKDAQNTYAMLTTFNEIDMR